MLTHLALVGSMTLLLAAGAAGLMRHWGGKRGGILAELAAGIGFIGGFIVLAGGVPWIEAVPRQRVADVALAATAAAAVAALTGLAGRVLMIAAGTAAAAGALWLISGGQPDLVTTGDWAQAAGFSAMGYLIAARLETAAALGRAAYLALAGVAAAMATIAFLAHAAPIAELDTVLAAALLGTLASAPPPRWRIGAAGLVLATALILALATELFRDAPARPWGLIVLGTAFAPEAMFARRGARGRRGVKQASPAILIGTVCGASAAAIALTAALNWLGF